MLQRLVQSKMSATSSTQQTSHRKLYPTRAGNSYKFLRNASYNFYDSPISNNLPEVKLESDLGRNVSSDIAERLEQNIYPSFQKESSVYTPIEEILPNYDYRESLEEPAEKYSSPFRRHAPHPEMEGTSEKQKKRLKKERKKRKRNKKKRRDKRIEYLLEKEGLTTHNYDGEEFIDCCPSKIIVVEKKVGKDRKNHAVEIRPSYQYFYESVCLPGIEKQDCVFPKRSLRRNTKTHCVQKYSFMQAQVRPYMSTDEWHHDYIHVRSGCSCQVSIANVKRRKKPKVLLDD